MSAFFASLWANPSFVRPHVVQLVVYNFQGGSIYRFLAISCFGEGLGAVELIWILATPSLKRARLASLPLFGSSTHHNFSRVYGLLIAGLIVASGIDLDYLVIPDALTVGGVVAGISLSYLFPSLQGKEDAVDAMIRSALSASVAGGSLWLVAKVASWLLQKEAMGIGDAKLLAALGAFLGWQSLPFILAISSLIGTIIGIGILKQRKQKLGVKVPFGPYLALAALLWLLGGAQK